MTALGQPNAIAVIAVAERGSMFFPARPTSIMVTTFGTGKISDEKLSELVSRHFDLRPKGIVQMLDLLRPIYEKTQAYGHFGRSEPEFTWEATDMAQALAADAGIKLAAVPA